MYCRESDQDLITLNKATSPPAPFLITHLLGRLEWFHHSQITSPPGTSSNSTTFSNPPVVHDLDLILCDTFSIMKYSGNSIGEQFRL